MPYVSGTPETKSVNERYIRVAAIDIEIIQGSWNICTASTCKENKGFPPSLHIRTHDAPDD
jgi:hypothetical protein